RAPRGEETLAAATAPRGERLLEEIRPPRPHPLLAAAVPATPGGQRRGTRGVGPGLCRRRVIPAGVTDWSGPPLGRPERPGSRCCRRRRTCCRTPGSSRTRTSWRSGRATPRPAPDG